MKPFRVTTRCALCDYTIAEHVQREHPEVRERYIILRRDQRG